MGTCLSQVDPDSEVHIGMPLCCQLLQTHCSFVFILYFVFSLLLLQNTVQNTCVCVAFASVACVFYKCMYILVNWRFCAVWGPRRGWEASKEAQVHGYIFLVLFRDIFSDHGTFFSCTQHVPILMFNLVCFSDLLC